MNKLILYDKENERFFKEVSFASLLDNAKNKKYDVKSVMITEKKIRDFIVNIVDVTYYSNHFKIRKFIEYAYDEMRTVTGADDLTDESADVSIMFTDEFTKKYNAYVDNTADDIRSGHLINNEIILVNKYYEKYIHNAENLEVIHQNDKRWDLFSTNRYCLYTSKNKFDFRSFVKYNTSILNYLSNDDSLYREDVNIPIQSLHYCTISELLSVFFTYGGHFFISPKKDIAVEALLKPSGISFRDAGLDHIFEYAPLIFLQYPDKLYNSMIGIKFILNSQTIKMNIHYISLSPEGKLGFDATSFCNEMHFGDFTLDLKFLIPLMDIKCFVIVPNNEMF